MPDNRSDSHMPMPLDKLTSDKTMTRCISKHPLAGDLGIAVEAIADCILSPRIAPAIPEQLVVIPAIQHQALDNR